MEVAWTTSPCACLDLQIAVLAVQKRWNHPDKWGGVGAMLLLFAKRVEPDRGRSTVPSRLIDGSDRDAIVAR